MLENRGSPKSQILRFLRSVSTAVIHMFLSIVCKLLDQVTDVPSDIQTIGLAKFSVVSARQGMPCSARYEIRQQHLNILVLGQSQCVALL